MPRHELTYPQTSLNTINRYAHNAHYDLTTVHTILNSTPVTHVSFNPPDSPFPTTIPLLARTGNFASPSSSVSEVQHIYLHASTSHRLFRLAQSTPQGFPVVLASTLVDGIVLSLTPFSHSLNYRSVVIHGYAQPVEDKEEKLYALKLLTNGIFPGRWEASRTPPADSEVNATGVMKVKVEAAAAKIRRGPPKEERRDVESNEVVEAVWTGVVPCWTQWGEGVEGGGGRTEGEVQERVKGEIKEVLEGWNEDGKKEAEERARK